MNPLSLAVCSSGGDPRSAATWSRTPLNVITALEEMGLEVHSYNTAPGRNRLYYAARNVLEGLGYKDSFRTGEHQRACVANLARILSQDGHGRVLHIAANDMPQMGKSSVQHFLFADYTFRLLVKYSPRAKKYTDKYIRVADELERESFHQMTQIFTTSQFVRENMIQEYGVPSPQITVVGTGLGNFTPTPGKKDYSRKAILFVARHSFFAKGGELLLAGWNIARQRDPAIRLTMVGDVHAPDTPGLTVLANEQPVEKLIELFNSSTLYAMPAFYESWGLVYLEAMACRTPVLGLARNALPELTGNGEFGFLVDEPEPEAVAEAILDAFSDPARLERMSEAAQAHTLENFSWQRTVRKMIDEL